MEQYGNLSVKKASDLLGRGVCITFYGAAGSGKTSLAANAEDTDIGKPLVFIDAEGGTRSIAHRKNIDIIELLSWSQLSDFTKSAIEDRDNFPWRTVVFDNLSEYLSLCVRHRRKGETTTQPEYQRITDDMLAFIRSWRDLSRLTNINVIFNIWDDDNKDELGMVRKVVAFTPSLQKQFPGIVDIIGYIRILNQPPKYTRVLSLQESPKTMAKFRRSADEWARRIPSEIPYGLDNLPLADILNVLQKGEEWPTKKYSTGSDGKKE